MLGVLGKPRPRGPRRASVFSEALYSFHICPTRFPRGDRLRPCQHDAIESLVKYILLIAPYFSRPCDATMGPGERATLRRFVKLMHDRRMPRSPRLGREILRDKSVNSHVFIRREPKDVGPLQRCPHAAVSLDRQSRSHSVSARQLILLQRQMRLGHCQLYRTRGWSEEPHPIESSHRQLAQRPYDAIKEAPRYGFRLLLLTQ